MAIAVRLPSMLLQRSGGTMEVQGEGATVGELLADLERRFPGITERLTAADGDLHAFVNIYRNDEDIRYLGKLSTPLQDGDVVSILPAISGG